MLKKIISLEIDFTKIKMQKKANKPVKDEQKSTDQDNILNQDNKLQIIELGLNYKLKSLDFLRYLTKFPSLSEISVSVLKDETVFVCSINQGSNPVESYFGFKICKCHVKKNKFSNTGWLKAVCVTSLIPQEKIDIDSVTGGINLI